PPNVFITVVTVPGDCVGSILYSAPGVVSPVMKTCPAATRIPLAPLAPPQVSSNLPSLARTRETVPPRFATHKSAPSEATSCGSRPTEVNPRPFSDCETHHWLRAPRRLPRLRASSTPLSVMVSVLPEAVTLTLPLP